MEPDGRAMNRTARTCANAYKLLESGHISVDDIQGIPVSSALEVVERVMSRLDTIERNAKGTGMTADDKVKASKGVINAGKQTIKDVREGKVANRDIRSTVDAHTFANVKGTKAELPLFRAFGKALTDQVYRYLRNDAVAEKLEQVVEALPQIVAEDDLSLVRQIGFDLEELESRSKNWRKKLKLPSEANVTPIQNRRIEGRV
jgi:hypothetical protein